MFEARLSKAGVFKKVIDSIRDIVGEVNWDCSSTGMSLQAMDSSHVCLVSVDLNADGFEPYRCDRNITLGINMKTMAVILKCSNNDDSITLRSQDNTDTCSFVFESPSGDRTSQYEMKLMDIDSEHLGIPETEYHATVKMPTHEFQKICRDMSQIGDSVLITCTKEGVQFSVSGDEGSGKVNLRQSSSVDKEDDQVSVELNEPVQLTFALRYLNHFSKASPLSPTVSLSLKADSPLAVEYKIQDFGSVRYFLAPKIDDEETAPTQDE